MAQRKASRKTSKPRQKTAKTPTRSAKTVARPVAGKKSSGRTRASRAPSKTSHNDPVPGDREVTIDRRRGNAQPPVAAVSTTPAPPALERRKKVNRRRQIDPTTCERDYTDNEVEFMNALDDYKRKSGRMFPTCSEVLEVVRSLGYVKLSTASCVANLEASPAPPVVESSFGTMEFEAEPLTHESL